MEIKMIPVDKIRPSPFQPRETFNKTSPKTVLVYKIDIETSDQYEY